jgi:hypothetical protein
MPPVRPIIFGAGAMAALAALLATGVVDKGLVPPAPEVRTENMTPVALPSLYDADEIIATRHRSEAMAVAVPGAAIDGKGLIGRNRDYGRMISPRLQLGAGAALRIGLHTDPQMAADGFRAVEVGTEAIAPDGEVVSIKPPDAPAGAQLSAGDRASGAAFFMADACPAMLALQADPKAGDIADAARQEAVVAALDRGLTWLMTHADDLQAADGAAPNRLLYDALAYHGCGVLAGNAEARRLAARFVSLALAEARQDGVFVEDGGADTTYQAVSVRLALDLLLTGYDGPDAARLNTAWQSGAQWLGTRIMADGRIDSTGNTRTCQGGERFLGREKKVWPPGIYGALIYAAELIPDAGLADAASRLATWARANPRVDPCFP